MSATPCAARPTNRGTAIEMAVSGIIGLCASFVLSIEAWQLAADQGRTFSCDVSSVLSCSAVAATPQARVLGFPNAFLGIFFEAVVLTVSFALIAGVRFPKWYYLGLKLSIPSACSSHIGSSRNRISSFTCCVRGVCSSQ